MARRLAALVPFYEYDERGSSAPTARRRTSPRGGAPASSGCSALYGTRFAETMRLHRRGRATAISDLQFTDAYRVPFQFSRYRARAPAVRRASCSRPPA